MTTAGQRPPPTTTEAFGYELGRLSRRWRNRLDEEMRPTGLTQARWVVLVHLARGADGLLQKDVANHVGIEGPTLVRILDRLEQQGMIERRPVPSDRRGKTVHLTRKGLAMTGAFDRIAARLRERILKDVDPDELERCTKLLRSIRARLEDDVIADVADIFEREASNA